MARRDDIPKTDPSENEALIKRLKQSNLAPLRKLMRFVGDELEREYLDVTPLAWGEGFTNRIS